tara:strand:- start:8015 stop:8917 length:903 start_codon:yes stop_codon:yes gene_type:complete
MRVYAHYARENWVIDRQAIEFNAQDLDFITVDASKADVIWIMSPWNWHAVPQKMLENKKVVCTIHHIVPEKFNLKEFLVRDHFVNMYHVPCQKTKDFISQYTHKPIEILGYWIDLDFWQPTNKLAARRELNLDPSDYIISSFQRDTEGSDLKSPKLEKGPDLFVEYVKKNRKKNTHVLLGGWRRQYIINELEKDYIKYTMMPLVSRPTLRLMYAASDLYVVSSRHEGGPQAILEASAMKTPIISTDVGIASAVLPPSCVFNVTESDYAPTKDDIKEAFNNVQQYNLKQHIQNYGMMFWRA